MKVLVADDSSTIRAILLDSLRTIGVADIVEAADGNEAISRFNQSRFDLVLTDWKMPGKSGLELLKAIRAKGSQVPVVMVTCEAEKRWMAVAAAAGVSDYLVKPFKADTLREKLKQFCRQ